LWPVRYVNNPRVIGQEPGFVSINATLEVDLLGQCASESLGSRMWSGSGGQADFARGAMYSPGGQGFIVAHATAHGGQVSRIVSQLTPGAAVTTIKNTVDKVVTEYGVADLKGKSDEECIQALICIADARFQSGLLAQARLEGKVDPAWEIPPRARHNTPAHLQQALAVAGADKFPRFPFGSDLQPLELHLAKSLRALKRQMSNWPGRLAAIGMLLRGGRSDKAREGLERLGLAKPKGLKQKLLARLVGAALCEQ
ncbi:MAG: hypothetical protein KDI56_10155, partial [Xanthomonadales bacterium]|nr:hypothetical protein [Xanthomonadales bacterium]